MIVPMKKISLIVLESEKKEALKKLRKLGLLHIEITEGRGPRIAELRETAEELSRACLLVAEYKDKNAPEESNVKSDGEALCIAKKIFSALSEKEELTSRFKLQRAELDRLSAWGEVDPKELSELAGKGVRLALYEMPPSEYKTLGDSVGALVLDGDKYSVRFIETFGEMPEHLKKYRVKLPEKSTAEIKEELAEIECRLKGIEEELKSYALLSHVMEKKIEDIGKEIEFEIYETGMDSSSLSEIKEVNVSIAYLVGYLPAEDTDKIKALARENAWGLMAEDPTPDDNAPTQIKNNKFVSLVYPLTDFLGTVPGYFEYDISAWFLGFILVFFGIIFGDGGYGLIICLISGLLILKAKHDKKKIPSAYLLILLMGGATVLWGILTCTWFGISPELLPVWLQKISVPYISNVYADTLWCPFFTDGDAALTTTQNLQILCFTLALIQLSAAHIMALVRNRKSLKLLGDIGSVLQLMGIYYIVLSLVVNSEVFSFGLVIGGIPVGTVAIALIAVGFLMSFVFANYDGHIGKAVLTSLKGIVSVLLGVVNVFSDIVSYIRLWAVGLAGAAISATVNELASPMLGQLVFIIFAIIILVFGHGLNMILNVLSVIVHGVRLNTLEFSTHLDMSWSGHKFKPFEE